MSTPEPNPTGTDRPEAQLKTRFELGLAAARDPVNRGALRGGPAITTLQSPWLFRHCPVCAHSFRIGDPVLIDVDHSIRHDSALLPCSGRQVAAPPRPAEISDFFTGLDAAWPPPPGLKLHRLQPGHELLALRGSERPICAYCGHSLRPHDQIVICPCRPAHPMCRIALHRDPMNGLNCWDAWCPDGKPTYCLATSRPLQPDQP